MSDDLSDEAVAWRMLEDRRSAQFVIHDERGWQDLEVTASQLHPSNLVVRNSGSDPVLLDYAQVTELRTLVNAVHEGTIRYPDMPRPCGNCGEIAHTPATCESAEWDTTP